MKKLYWLVAILLLQVHVFAQHNLTGIITSKPDGEPLQGATIKLKDRSDDKKKLNVVSGLDGRFIIKNIPAGSYKIKIEYTGFEELEQEFELAASKDINLQLEIKQHKLKDVSVTGTKDKSSEAASQMYERKAVNVINSVSARAIEISPDLSVANVTQRVSGVSLQRSTNGEGQYAIVRGMEKRYNTTLINGIKIPSPDNKNRYVPLDIFPADLLDRLEITKALTPNMEADAIGGVVNLVMKDAPSTFTVKANAAAGYAQAFSDHKFVSFDHKPGSAVSPRINNGDSYLAGMQNFPVSAFTWKTHSNPPIAGVFGISAGGRTKDKKLGGIIAGSYQSSYRDVRSLFFDTEVNRETNDPAFKSVQRRNYSISQFRTGLHGKFDYKINSHHKLSLYTAFVNLAQNEYRFVSDTNLVLGRTAPGTGRISNTYRTTRLEQKIYNITLQGEHKLAKDLKADWSLVYSKATGNQPDRASLDLVTGVVKEASGNLRQDPTYLDNSSSRTWTKNSDEDKTAFLNFTYESEAGDVDIDWTAGGMYRYKDRNSVYDKYNLRPDPSPQMWTGDINANSFAVFNPQGSSSDPLNYSAVEKVGGYYAMAKIKTGKLQTVAGVRVEHTDLSWTTSAPKTVEGTDGSIKYYDILPSVHLKYALTKKQNLRASFFSSISRPGFYEVIPHIGGDPDADYTDAGNPYLKRVTAENFDVRYELFPKGLDQLLAGVFYKQIKNPIEYAIVERGVSTFYSPSNFGTGHNYGFELDITKYFRSFGVKANYTFTSSTITTSKIRRFRDAQGTLTQETVQQSRPLQGQSKSIGNLSLLYKSPVHGLDVQLAMVYTGRRIAIVSPFVDNDTWQKSFTQLDFSAEKTLGKYFSVYVKINNLLNTPYELEIRKANKGNLAAIPEQTAGENVFIRKDTYGANYLLGFRFKL